MDKTVYVEIAGKNYPMRFSLGAAKEINKKYGSLEKMQESLTSEEDAIDVAAFLMELLIRQGCAYKNIFEKDMPIPDGAPVKNEEYIPLNTEQIMVSLELAELGTYKEKIYATVSRGQVQEVVTKETEKGKNADTTQG
jgi:hypothetical protein